LGLLGIIISCTHGINLQQEAKLSLG